MQRYRLYLTGNISKLDDSIEVLKEIGGLLEVRFGLSLPRPQARVIPVTLVEFEGSKIPPKMLLSQFEPTEYYDELDQFRRYPAKSDIIFTTVYERDVLDQRKLDFFKGLPFTSRIFEAEYPDRGRVSPVPFEDSADGLVAIVGTTNPELFTKRIKNMSLDEHSFYMSRETQLYPLQS